MLVDFEIDTNTSSCQVFRKLPLRKQREFLREGEGMKVRTSLDKVYVELNLTSGIPKIRKNVSTWTLKRFPAGSVAQKFCALALGWLGCSSPVRCDWGWRRFAIRTAFVYLLSLTKSTKMVRSTLSWSVLDKLSENSGQLSFKTDWFRVVSS